MEAQYNSPGNTICLYAISFRLGEQWQKITMQESYQPVRFITDSIDMAGGLHESIAYLQ